MFHNLDKDKFYDKNGKIKHSPKLNDLINSSGVNNPKKSCSTIELARRSKLRTPLDLMIEFEKVTGKRVTDLVREMHEHQTLLFKEYTFDLEQCYVYLTDLFFDKTIQGLLKEDEAIEELKSRVQGCQLRGASVKEDNTYATDIMVGVNGQIVAGIQVKPESYKYKLNTDTHANNLRKNAAMKRPVFYLYYGDNGFTNIAEAVEFITSTST